MSALASFIGQIDPAAAWLAGALLIVVLGAVPLFWPRKRRPWWIWLLSAPVWIAAAFILFGMAVAVGVILDESTRASVARLFGK